MTEEEIKKQIKKAKRFNYSVFAIFVIIAVILGISLIKYKLQREFSTSRWIANPSERVDMIDDMLSENELVGKTKEEIISLLGNDNGDDGPDREGDIKVYYLGDEPGLVSIDSAWLVIAFSDGVVSGFEVKTD